MVNPTPRDRMGSSCFWRVRGRTGAAARPAGARRPRRRHGLDPLAFYLADGKLRREMLLAALPAGQMVAALIAAHAISRGCAVTLMATMDYARDDDASKARPVAARLGIRSLGFALVCAALPLLMLPPAQSVPAVALAVLTTLWLAAKCRRWLGGYTGDCLGAVQQLAEIGFYLGLTLTF